MKILFYLLMAGALFVSCNEEFDDWAKPQSNLPEDEVPVTFSVKSAGFIDLGVINSDLDSIELFSPTLTFPVNYILKSYEAFYLRTDTLEDNSVVSTKIEIPTNDVGEVAVEDLQNLIINNYGRRPLERSFDLLVVANMYTSDKKTMVVKKEAEIVSVSVIPEAPFIASSYYLVGDMFGWDAEHMVQFSHSDADVYDDPVFSIIFNTTADNQYWKIIPQSNIDAGDFWANPGVVGTVTDGESALTGTLVNNGANAGKIETAGKYRMTINMMDYTYSIEPILFENFVYFIGATDGWSNAEQKLALASEDGLYKGFVYCADPNGWGNEFKFQRVAGSWDNEINTGTFTGGITGDFEGTDGGNIKVSAGEGVYYVEMNLSALTLKAFKVETMGVVGDFTGWADGADVIMTWNAADYCYEATGTGATSNGWKFRVNGSWDINLGGSMDALDYNGDNINVDANIIKLYLTRKTNDNIYCTVQ